ncbi:ETC complex I subunit conserved region-domain-containing protein [Lipomyces japonicus]|uniref:ETC complex I subunit conserved region-domain-containing protein n=1 Tax=Lipomyces japonicus TaxID=56871 RepID=UPI0034CECF46
MRFSRVLSMRPSAVLRKADKLAQLDAISLEEARRAYAEQLKQSKQGGVKSGFIEIPYRANSGNKTGVTGIYEYPESQPRLQRLYFETLRLLEKFPEDSVYRKAVEGLTKHRAAIVESAKSREEIEKKIGGGLIEEILIQAGEEFRLAQNLLKWKAWEPLEEKPPKGVWESATTTE